MKNQNTIQKIAKAQKILRKAKLVLMVLAVMMTASREQFLQQIRSER